MRSVGPGDYVSLECYGFRYSVQVKRMEENGVTGQFFYRSTNDWSGVVGFFLDPVNVMKIDAKAAKEPVDLGGKKGTTDYTDGHGFRKGAR